MLLSNVPIYSYSVWFCSTKIDTLGSANVPRVSVCALCCCTYIPLAGLIVKMVTTTTDQINNEYAETYCTHGYKQQNVSVYIKIIIQC